MFSLHDLSWNVAFRNDDMSILSVRWAPDSEHILVLNECALQTSIWSIRSRKLITLPGFRDLRRYCSFSHDSKWLAFLHRISTNGPHQQDAVSIVSTVTWECVNTFPISTTQAICVAADNLVHRRYCGRTKITTYLS